MLLKKLSTVRVLLCLPATASIIILCSCPLSRRECTSHKSGTIFATTASIAGNRIVGVLTKPDFCDNYGIAIQIQVHIQNIIFLKIAVVQVEKVAQF